MEEPEEIPSDILVEDVESEDSIENEHEEFMDIPTETLSASNNEFAKLSRVIEGAMHDYNDKESHD